VTRARFGEWNMMHTTFNRYVFVGVYFLVPVFFVLREINFWLILGFSAAICLACFEETVTLFKLETYDVGNKGVIGEKLQEKAARFSRRSA